MCKNISFYDYFMIDDENLAIIIGDASGKGVPAAIISMTTQAIVKQILNHVLTCKEYAKWV